MPAMFCAFEFGRTQMMGCSTVGTPTSGAPASIDIPRHHYLSFAPSQGTLPCLFFHAELGVRPQLCKLLRGLHHEPWSIVLSKERSCKSFTSVLALPLRCWKLLPDGTREVFTPRHLDDGVRHAVDVTNIFSATSTKLTLDVLVLQQVLEKGDNFSFPPVTLPLAAPGHPPRSSNPRSACSHTNFSARSCACAAVSPSRTVMVTPQRTVW